MTIINIFFKIAAFGMCFFAYKSYQNGIPTTILLYYFAPMFINIFVCPRIVNTENPADYSMDIVGKMVSLVPFVNLMFSVIVIMNILTPLFSDSVDFVVMLSGRDYKKIKRLRKNKFKKDIQEFFDRKKTLSNQVAEKVSQKINAEYDDRYDADQKIKAPKEKMIIGQSKLDN